VAGQGRFDGDFGGLRVPDFADHDDVGVLAEDRAEHVGKGQPDFLFGRHLVDAGNLELDRVLYGHDIVNRVVEFVERGIQGRGFAGPRRAGDQDQPVRGINGRLELLERIRVQPQFVYAGGQVGLVQKAEHHLFPVHRGHDGNAQVVVLAAHADAHAAVLRLAAFRDVQAAHDFEAGDQGQLHLFGRRGGVHQYPVNPVAQPQRFVERLDMHVAGAVLHRLDQDEVGQLDDGRLFGGGSQFVQVDLLDRLPGHLHVVRVLVGNGLFLRVLDDVLDAAAPDGVNLGQLVLDRLFRGDQHGHFHPGDVAHVVAGQDVERVGHGQEQLVFQPRDGHHLMVVGDFPRKEVGHFQGDVEVRQVDGRDVEHAPHRHRHVQIGDVGFFQQQLEQAGAFLLLQFEYFRDLLAREQAVFDQDVNDAFAK